jgi:hypothetical protein
MTRHKWVVTTKDPSFRRRPQTCKNCGMLRGWTRDGVRADGHTPRYVWRYATKRGFVVPDRAPLCSGQKASSNE